MVFEPEQQPEWEGPGVGGCGGALWGGAKQFSFLSFLYFLARMNKLLMCYKECCNECCYGATKSDEEQAVNLRTPAHVTAKVVMICR